MIRRHLDYARFCVASGLLFAFPENFPGVMNSYDVTQSTVIWGLFRKQLFELYLQYHEIEPQNGGFVLYQTVSCFVSPAVGSQEYTGTGVM